MSVWLVSLGGFPREGSRSNLSHHVHALSCCRLKADTASLDRERMLKMRLGQRLWSKVNQKLRKPGTRMDIHAVIKTAETRCVVAC